MKCYLLLIKGSFAEWNALSPQKQKEMISQFGDFAKELGNLGYMRGGDGCNERSFRLLTKEMPTDKALIDPKTKDMVTGYFLIEVPDEKVALEIARKCPAFNFGEYVELVPCSQ